MSEVENKTMVTEEDLSKAIDMLIEETFGKAEGAQPKNEFDELPKDEDVKANGGKDVIKAEEDEEEKKRQEELEESKKAKVEPKKEEKLEKETKKCMKKSEEEVVEVAVEKSEEAAPSKEEELVKSLDAVKAEKEELVKSFDLYKAEVEKKMADMGEIFKGLKYEIDTLKKSPAPRQSLKSVTEIQKSFVGNEASEGFEKSDVMNKIEDLVKSGTVSASVGTEYEMFGKISNRNARELVMRELLKEKK